MNSIQKTAQDLMDDLVDFLAANPKECKKLTRELGSSYLFMHRSRIHFSDHTKEHKDDHYQ
jgi:hypothetical protein